MISVVVCSRSLLLFEKLSHNVAETIGVIYELIRIDNGSNQYDIAQAYNEGASGAVYPYLCFLHEDIFFTKNNWGKLLIGHFNSCNHAGLIGVAGAVYKGAMPCGWWEAERDMEEIRRMHIVHQKNQTEAGEILLINPYNETVSEVVVIDGVFMAMPKNVWHESRFDEKIRNGFHGYDLDISFQVLQQKKKILVVYDIGIVHFSAGKKDKAWLDALLKVHEKWRGSLPLVSAGYKAVNANLYRHNMSRLKKNMLAYMQYEKGFLKLLRVYHRYFSFAGKQPGFKILMKDYLSGLLKIVKASLGKKLVHTW